MTGRYVPFGRPRPTTVGAAVEGLTHAYDAPGRIHFEIDGQPLALTASGGRHGDLLVLFTDATPGVTTYAANRALSVEAPDDGWVRLDINRATNLPCLHRSRDVPAAPAENRLPIAVEAGSRSRTNAAEVCPATL